MEILNSPSNKSKFTFTYGKNIYGVTNYKA